MAWKIRSAKLNPTVNDKSRGLIIAQKVLMITVDYVSIIFLVNHQLAERCVDVGIALDIRAMENRPITHQFGLSLNRKATWIWQIGRIIVLP